MNSKEVLKSSLESRWREYEMFLVLIELLEIFMVIYGLISFDFHVLRRRLYFASYIFLIICSTISLAVNRHLQTHKFNPELAVTNVTVYTCLLIFWSAFVSSLDLIHQSFPVTYMTILAAVSGIIALDPAIFTATTLLSSVFMIGFTVVAGGRSLLVPFYINHFIFLIVMIIVQYRSYRATSALLTANDKLKSWAVEDELTGIGNRRALDTYMKKLVNSGTKHCFVLLDIDNFKTINDSYGHNEGDLSLAILADTLSRHFGSDVFRYGGDEFAVVSFSDAQALLNEFREINRELKEKVHGYSLQICAGIYYCDGNQELVTIFENADKALYQAKQGSKASVAIYKEG